jgi:CubicO group peptidase (beta-lactamase class C family)
MTSFCGRFTLVQRRLGRLVWTADPLRRNLAYRRRRFEEIRAMRMIGKFLLGFTLLAAGTAMATARQSKGPTREEMARELLRVINTRDTASIRRFVEQHFVTTGPDARPAPARAARIAELTSGLGQLDVRRVDTTTANEVTAVALGQRTEEWMRFTLLLDETPARRIRGVRIGPAPAEDVPNALLSDAAIVEQLKGYVERLASRDAFSGTVLLAKAGKPLYRAAFGEANKDFGVRNTVDTKFNLGSMNKMFTSVSVLQLSEKAKLSLDDTLGKFLPAGAMRPEVLSKVRIKHLLSHTSGLGSYFTAEWDRMSRARFRTVDDWMALVKSESLAFEPGTRWAYSNTGMLVLGKVIEVASGQDYFAYVREHIYAPAGMTNSDAFELDYVNRNLAVGYEPEQTPNGIRYRNNIFQHVIRGGPAGGGYSTVDDLTRFAEALKAGRLVNVASVRLLMRPKPELSSPQYGFGFVIDEGGKIVGHSGGFPGINSQLDVYVGEEYTFAVMANYGGAAQRVAQKVRTLVLAGRRASASR